MSVSAVIATRNRPALIGSCLLSLGRSSRPPAEILVIDQSDGAETERALAALDLGSVPLRYEHVPPRGKSSAINRGAELATGEFLALTDDDVEADDGWLQSFADLRERHPDVRVFCGSVLPEAGTNPDDYLNLVLGRQARWIGRGSNPLNTGFCGANVLIDRAVFLELGGYDPLFGPGGRYRCVEDGELAYRLTRRGFSILYSPELAVYHSGWRREQDNECLMLDYAFGLGAFAGHYARRGDVRPSLALLKKLAWKSLRLAGGLVRRERGMVTDGALHLEGASRGFLEALTAS